MMLARKMVRNGGFLLAVVIAAWLGTEIGGKGTGAVKWLLSPAPTRDTSFHPVDIVGARPKGPARLSAEEAAAVEARIAAAFEGRQKPAYRRTSQMGEYFALKAGPMDAFFGAVLASMHPSTEHVLWLMAKADSSGPGRGEPVPVAVFVGPDGKLKIAFDLRKALRHADYTAYTMKRFDKLEVFPGKVAADGVVIVDDPGPLRSPGGSAAAIFVFGGTNPPENNILGLVSQGDFAERQRFFAAVLGKFFDQADADVPHAVRALEIPKAVPAPEPRERDREAGKAALAARAAAARKRALEDRRECFERAKQKAGPTGSSGPEGVDARNKGVDLAAQCDIEFGKAMDAISAARPVQPKAEERNAGQDKAALAALAEAARKEAGRDHADCIEKVKRTAEAKGLSGPQGNDAHNEAVKGAVRCQRELEKAMRAISDVDER